MAPAAMAQSGAWGQCEFFKTAIELKTKLTSLRWGTRLDRANCKSFQLYSPHEYRGFSQRPYDSMSMKEIN